MSLLRICRIDPSARLQLVTAAMGQPLLSIPEAIVCFLEQLTEELLRAGSATC